MSFQDLSIIIFNWQIQSVNLLTFHSTPYHLVGNKQRIYEDIGRKVAEHEFQLHRNYRTTLPIKP